jgi:hypothetical protein
MRFSSDAGLTAVSTLVFLAILELGLRVVGLKYVPSLYTDDPDRGYALRPGAHGWQSDEGETYIRINREGYRDREHTIARPKNTVRIAFLGDSAVEARAVELDRTFPAVVERTLNECTDRRVGIESLSFGVPGYNLVQLLQTLRISVWKYDPQIVVLALSMNNAVIKNSRQLHVQVGQQNRFPIYVYQRDRLVPDAVTIAFRPLNPSMKHLKDSASDLVNESQLLHLAIKAFLTERARWRGGSRTREQNPAQAELLPYLPPTGDSMKNAWSVTEGLLLLIASETRQHHAEFWLVTLDTPEQDSPNPEVRQDWTCKLGKVSPYYADKELNDFAQEHELCHLMLAPLMARNAAARNVYLHGFFNTPPGTGHWNDAGHELAGKLIASALCRDSQVLNGYVCHRVFSP